MRFVSAEATSVLQAGGFEHHWVADISYDGTRKIQDVPLYDVRLTDDDTSAIKGTGQATIIWTDDFGKSILPNEIGDLFSPFGTELTIYSVLTSGRLTERVQYGVFQVTDVPNMRDELTFFRGMSLSAGSVLELTLKDRLWTVQNDPFDVPSAPTQLASVYT